jgi:hypothetical protein
MEPTNGIQDDRDKEMCAIALDEAFSLCGNNTVIFEQIATIMGIRKTDLSAVTPLDKKYQGVLNGGLHDDKWVIARAWDLVVNDGIGIMDAFNQAWDETEQSKNPVAAPFDDRVSSAPVAPSRNDEPYVDEEFPVE